LADGDKGRKRADEHGSDHLPGYKVSGSVLKRLSAGPGKNFRAGRNIFAFFLKKVQGLTNAALGQLSHNNFSQLSSQSGHFGSTLPL
jgi:hypothetical protein